MENMQITEFAAKNLFGLPKNELGVPEVRLSIGTSVEIVGINGSGKSSILNAMRAALAGGSLEDIKNVHTDGTPEATVVFDDGRIRLERTGNRLSLLERVKDDAKGDAYKKLDQPQTRLNAWFDKDASNPINFIRADQKQRLDLFLRALPLTLTDEQVQEALGAEVMSYESVRKTLALGGHPLVLLGSLHETIYAERRGINRSEDQKRDAVKELTQDLPAGDPSTAAADLKILELERDDRTNRLVKARNDAETTHLRATSAAVNGRKAFEATRRQKLEADIAELRKVAEADIRLELEREQASRKDADEARTAALSALASDQVDLDAVTQRLADARSQIERAAKDQRTRELADKYKAEADGLKGKSAALSAGLESIVVLKAALLSALPIPGLTVTDKDIFVDGVAFQMLNEGAQLDLAIDVMILRASKFPLKVVFIDGAEAFDTAHRERVKERLSEAGVLCVMARTTDDPRVGVTE